MKKPIKARQGDVFVTSIPSLPANAVELNTPESRIAARGEWSDHSHVITGDAKIYRAGDKMYVDVKGAGAKLQHTLESRLPLDLATCGDLVVADHGIIELEPNTIYEISLQNEYNPFSKVFEKVLD